MQKLSLFRISLIIAIMFSLTTIELSAAQCKGTNFEQWSNCQSSYTWEDGAQYSGGWLDGNLNGYGTYIFADDNVWSLISYEGFYKNDDMHGYGKLTWQDGGYYEGDFVQNDPHGYGIHRYISGNQYEGFYKYGRPDGQGTYKWNDGSSYSGEWKGGDQHGYGTYSYSNGDVYEGNFVADLRHGYGKITNADGTSYEGEWSNDERVDLTSKTEVKKNSNPEFEQCSEDSSLHWTDCYGEHESVYGTRYSGLWKNNKAHGEGVLYYSDGEKLSGVFENGLLEGKGKYYFKNGDIYDGNFRNSLLHGEGEILQDDGSRLKARWYQNEIVKITIQFLDFNSDEAIPIDHEYITKCPYSVDVLWNNCFAISKIGDEYRYEGIWRHDNPDGFGKLFYKEELGYQGGIKNGLLHGLGELFLSEDMIFTGNFKHGLKDGKGSITQIGSQKEVHGTWVNGDLDGDLIVVTESGEKRFLTYDYEQDIFQNKVAEFMSQGSE